MKAISLHQPWATFMADGWKRIETRSWGTPHRGLLAIHAAKARDSIKDDLYPLELLRRARIVLPGGNIIHFPLGAVVAVVEVFDCYEVSAHRGSVWGSETIDTRGVSHIVQPADFVLGDLSPGRFGWPTDHLRRLRTPVSCRGMQGLFTLPPEVEAAVNAEIMVSAR